MSWQQIAMIVWLTLVVGIGMTQDGKPREGKESFLRSLIAAAVMAVILYTGGFWG